MLASLTMHVCSFNHSRCSPSKRKEAVVFRALLILIVPVLGLHVELNHLKNEANTVIHAGGNIGVK